MSISLRPQNGKIFIVIGWCYGVKVWREKYLAFDVHGNLVDPSELLNDKNKTYITIHNYRRDDGSYGVAITIHGNVEHVRVEGKK